MILCPTFDFSLDCPGSDAVDSWFVSHLGVNCLLRESVHADTPHELGRLVHRFGGGQAVGTPFPEFCIPLSSSLLS